MKTEIETTTNRRIYHILHSVDQDPYPEEYGEYQKHKRGFRGYWKSRLIYRHQVRMYRTWKHTRKHQWKL
jgi:Txe/YoeB family toxin of Txe-Axe toxin-antitoxin module